jgi:DNA-binding NarL/FixJ family response regulator
MPEAAPCAPLNFKTDLFMNMKLMIIDDHEGMRTTIRRLISLPDDSVVECGSGDEALQALTEFKPDCAIVDIRMPGKCAFKTMRAICDLHPPTRVVCVTDHDLPEYRRAAFEAGATSFVAKANLSDLQLLVSTQRLFTCMKL